MGRLVVVSNRIVLPVGGKASAGGLAVGILDALKHSGGVWFGWNGEIAEISGEEEPLEVMVSDGITYASFSLDQNDYDLYYTQYSNAVIWPAFHYRLDLVDYQRTAWEGYCRVNKLLAQRLQPLLESQDIIWAHDYHLMPLADELRKLGNQQPVGFFCIFRSLLRKFLPHYLIINKLCRCCVPMICLGFRRKGINSLF